MTVGSACFLKTISRMSDRGRDGVENTGDLSMYCR